MDLTLSEEDQLLAEVVLKVACERRPRVPPVTAPELDQDAWKKLADLGVLALGTPEPDGGAGGSWQQATLALETFASKAFAPPFIGCGVLAPSLLAAAPGNQDLTRDLSRGSRLIGIGLKPGLEGLACIGEDEWAVGFDCAGADSVIVLGGREPLHLVLMEPSDPLASPDILCTLRRVDLNRTVPVQAGGQLPDEALADWCARAVVALSADLAGTMQGATALAIDHAKVRKQFGTSIGSFQAVQHIIADQFVSSEAATWGVRYAAWEIDNAGSRASARLAASVSKAYTAELARPVCESTVQILGGTGFTWDSWAHIYLRRAILRSVVLGDQKVHGLAINQTRTRSI